MLLWTRWRRNWCVRMADLADMGPDIESTMPIYEVMRYDETRVVETND